MAQTDGSSMYVSGDPRRRSSRQAAPVDGEDIRGRMPNLILPSVNNIIYV